MTKDQRHIAYIIMREEIEDYWGLCYCWLMTFEECILYKNMRKHLPEYAAKRTTKKGSKYFFNSMEERLKALDECIKETA